MSNHTNNPSRILATASNPGQNITVSASAGTGKTYLLVTRIIRLLMAGVKPHNILAVTFTRKAAGEMQERLYERLWQIAMQNETDLNNTLESLDIPINAQNRDTAHHLYESLLFSKFPIRISTFHSFCQDILKRFPLEANVPAGFELIENNQTIIDQAWDALFLEATQNPNTLLSQALEILFKECSGLYNTQTVLINAFLSHRSDWWAYIEKQNDPIQYANDKLHKFFDLKNIKNPYQNFFSPAVNDMLLEFSTLLNKHPTSTNLKHAEVITTLLNASNNNEQAFESIKTVFLTEKLEPRKRTINKTLISKLSETGATRFIDLHENLSNHILDTHEYILQINFIATNDAWFTAGNTLLSHYQRIKLERRLLDFTDLEWKTYKLLHEPDHAHWVHYKLDQKIEHLLIDEFQDTNPTQWQLTLPILEEMASGDSERNRSTFLVGDRKQSIYSFRRANSELQNIASQWMNEHMNATPIPLNHSWRSSQSIIDCLNHVFSAETLQQKIPYYEKHETHQKSLWGKVEILPLVTPTDDLIEETISFRNPLLMPRTSNESNLHLEEGRIIAQRIKSLINTNIAVGTEERPIEYSDFFILIRNRTHANAYEQALAEENIPYIGTEKGTLLHSLEIRDIEALLRYLISPFNNMALAQVLRSPLFSITDDELILLANDSSSNSWFERLENLTQENKITNNLQNAYQTLKNWMQLAGHIPIHDLLDKIYHEANVIESYASSVPATTRNRVIANLNRFIALALEIDSGRYPNLSGFLTYISKLRNTLDSSDESTDPNQQTRVRLMTIHAAKGLEAPIVFLADCANTEIRNDAYDIYVDWPANHSKPSHLLLTTTQKKTPKRIKTLLEKQQQQHSQEQAHLLYVALSRAQHMLVISGNSLNSDKTEKHGWYQIIHDALIPHASNKDKTLILENGQTKKNTISQPAITSEVSFDDAFEKTRTPKKITKPITPSKNENNDEFDEYSKANQERGILIHRLIEYQSHPNPRDLSSINKQKFDPALLKECQTETHSLINSNQFKFLFDPDEYEEAYNEMPITYISPNNKPIYGIIDRVVVNKDTVWVIDYKTHKTANEATVAELAKQYVSQLKYYSEGVKKIWPAKKIKAALLFTACHLLYEID